MNGRKPQNRNHMILGFALLISWILVAPAYAVKPVAVFLSADEEAYTGPVAAFSNEIDMPVEIYNLNGDVKNGEDRMTEILSRDPALIFALGAKAAYIAKIETLKRKRQDIPVVFAMVLNWERYELLKGSTNIAGIATDMDPGTQFANMKLFAPDVKKIGVVYSDEHSSGIITKARQVAKILGLELTTQPIKKQKDFRRAFKKMSGDIHAYWILTDPIVFSTRNMDWLKKNCAKKRIITIGQSENVVKLGMLLGINTDTHYIGIQAASMVRNILFHNQSPESIGVMPPLGTSLVLNTKTANKIGLKINEIALSMANTIIE